MLVRSFLIESSSKFLVTRTGIKARLSSILGRIRPFILEFLALEWWKMGKWCLHARSFIFGWIIIKVAGNQDRDKSLEEFDFGPLVSMAHLYVIWNERMSSSACGWSKGLFLAHLSRRLMRWAYSIPMVCPSVRHPHFQTWISLKPVGQSWSNFMCSITGVGERQHKVLGQIGSKSWFPWQQKAPIDL